MTDIPSKRDIFAEIDKLGPEARERVLTFIRSLDSSLTGGVPGRRLLSFAGAISREDLRAMSLAIEEACEEINRDEW